MDMTVRIIAERSAHRTNLGHPGHVTRGDSGHAGGVVLVLAEMNAVKTASLQLQTPHLQRKKADELRLRVLLTGSV